MPLRNDKGQFISEDKLLVASCRYCGIEIRVYESKLAGGRGKYCSRRCLGKATISTKVGNWQANQELPQLDLTEAQKSYLAGFIDGEGSIGIARHNSKVGRGVYYSPIVSVYNTDPDILPMLCQWTGLGSVYLHQHNKERDYRPCFIWRIEAMRARTLLSCILPYLRIKKRQAELAIDCPKDGHLRDNRNEQLALKEAIMILNQGGQ